VRSCAYCTRLVADFAEAEHAAGAPQAEPATVRLLTPARLAAAAAVLLAVGVGVLLWAARARPAGPVLASAEVGLESEIRSGMTPKGPRQFATGQKIMFRVDLARDGYVSVLNLDSAGRVMALPPLDYSSDLWRKMPEGTARLGPYRLNNVVGPETWFVVATRDTPPDVKANLGRLEGKFHPVDDRRRLAETIRSWPAEVRVITFQHVEGPAEPAP
jgi:hypothetical protein